jgi:hypothetical protein
MKIKTYLRVLEIKAGKGTNASINIIEGNIKEDKKYWLKQKHTISVRYFKLQEVKT